MNKNLIINNLNIKDYYSAELPSLKSNSSGMGMALCPFHNDHKPSLSINLNAGKGQFKCHGCGKSGSIFDFYIARHGVNFQIALQELGKQAGLSPEVKRKIVKTYDYRDVEEKLIFQVCRYEPKSFSQRRPDGKGNWIYNLEGITPIPYNLQDVIKPENKDVFIVEGEKDVESLRAIGIIASCNPMGAGKWKPEYNQYFKGKRIVIIPDNDKAGKDHALTVAKNLYDIAEDVKVIELPNLKEKEDISNWLQKDGNKEHLLEIINQTPEFKKPSPFISSIDLIVSPNSEPLKWIVEGLLPSNSVTLIAGEPGSYKTWLALSLAKSVSEGEPFLNRHTKRMKVYYIDRENPRELIINRLNMIGRAKDFIFWGLWSNPEPPQLGDISYLEIAKEKPLIIFDTLLKFHQGDENSSRDMGIVSRHLTMLRDAGATVLVLHHKGKSPLNDYRGSSEIVGGVDIAYSLSKAKEEGGILSLKGIKNRFISEPHLTIEVKSTEDTLTFDDISREKERVREFEEKEKMLEIREIIDRFYQEHERYPNQGEILERVKTIQGRNEVVRLLNRGKGVYWNIEEGKQGSKIYIPLKASHLPDIYNKRETGKVEELLEITI